MKRIYLILVLLMSLVGFSSAAYMKYIKTFEEFPVKTSLVKMKSRDLTLNDMIKFLDKMNEATSSLGVNAPSKIDNSEAIRTLKNINLAALIGMVVFGLTSVWSGYMLIKKRQE
ncbi:hypothetical protein EYV94_23355 [Puteibacter caeruleilacunae]|nr:hypothetical protein EYV94_23355 [Puteibacter caeruleilacunae]